MGIALFKVQKYTIYSIVLPNNVLFPFYYRDVSGNVSTKKKHFSMCICNLCTFASLFMKSIQKHK